MINLFCALPAEAKPVIRRYNLSRINDTGLFETYINKERRITLTVTGVGKQSAAGGVVHSYMLLSGQKNDGRLNIGIAGHANLSPGTPVLVNKAIDFASQRKWFPQILFKHNLITGPAITLDTPSSRYPDTGVIDLEAFGFFEMATKVGLLELSHSIKVVSDNRQHHYFKIKSGYVSELIEANLEQIDGIINEISDLSVLLDKPEGMEEIYKAIVSRWHFTTTRSGQLKKLLCRWNVILPHESLLMKDLQTLRNSKDILKYITERLDNVPVRLT